MHPIPSPAKACRNTAPDAGARPSRRAAFAAGALLASALLVSVIQPVAAQSLVLDKRIELPSVQGRLDHLSIDVEGERLFVAALGADSVEVIDLRAGKRIARLQPMHEPQGVVYMPESRRLFVANGAGGSVQAFADGQAPAAASADALDDADNLRIRASENHLFVGYAHALAVVDTNTLRIIKRIELPGHPEGFEVERVGQLIYLNVPSAKQIVVVDHHGGRITATWDIAGASQNFPMTFDEPNHRLLVATRRPPSLLVWDTATGKRVAELPICGDADDLFFDSQRHQLYAICGEGVVQVIRQRDADHYEVVERVATAPGARTGLFVPALSTLYVAVPSRGGAAAEVPASSPSDSATPQTFKGPT